MPFGFRENCRNYHVKITTLFEVYVDGNELYNKPNRQPTKTNNYCILA